MGEWINVKDKLPDVKNNRTEFLCRCILDGDVIQVPFKGELNGF